MFEAIEQPLNIKMFQKYFFLWLFTFTLMGNFERTRIKQNEKLKMEMMLVLYV